MRNTIDVDAIEAELASVIYWATRTARRQLLGDLPAPDPDEAAYALLERVRARQLGPTLHE